MLRTLSPVRLMLAILLASTPALVAGGALAEPGTIVILDGSNSMWSQVSGKNKIAIAQEALQAAFASPAGRRGLIAYGNGSDGSCSDVNVIVPPDGEMTAEARKKAIDAVSPKGATPIARSIEQAAEAGKGLSPLHLVVVADGTDTCGGDAAAAAGKIRQGGGRVDVIGFVATQPDKVQPLKVVADAGGGSFAVASSEDAFKTALNSALSASPGAASTAASPRTGVVTGSISGSSGQEEEAAPDDESPADEVEVAQAGIPLPPPRPDPNAPFTIPSLGPLQIQPDLQEEAEQKRLTLRLAAHLTEGGPALPGGVIWRVFRARPQADGSFPVVERSEDPEPVFLLPEGQYVVHAAYGRASIAQQIDLRGEAKTADIVLQAGGLKINAIGTDSQPLPGAVALSIYSSEQDEYGQRKLILDNAPLDRIVRLNPGTYHIVSRCGDANAVVRADVRIQPGKLTEATVTHRAAAVTLKLVNEPGGEALANTAWSILSPGGDVVKESFGAFPEHVLAAGNYAVVARHEGRTYTADFSVDANANREVEVVAR